MAFVSKDAKHRIFRCARNERGFSMLEMIFTVIILGILAGAAWWILSGTVNVGVLNAASTRAARAMTEAYSIAQNENIPVTLSFHSNTSADTAIQNTYEILRGTASTPMPPPKGVTYYSSAPGGVTHYYCRLTGDGSRPTISSDQSMPFVPSGATTKLTGTGTVTIQYQGKTATVTVSQEGRVTF